MNLSVIITSLNENSDRLNKTIQTIRDNSDDTVEIIVIDDCSDIPVSNIDTTVKLFRNENRIGCAPARHFGATIASGKYILFTDAHMIYHPEWYSSFLKISSNLNNTTTAICGTCLGLDDTHTEIDKSCGSYVGARLSLHDKRENQIIEGKWIQEKEEKLYEISCMMGAIYFINREYFLTLRGLSELKMWGSDEPCLALKILQSGGKMVVSKDIKAGHFFRNKSPYSTGVQYLVYNKIRMAKTLLPDELGQKLIDKLPKDGNYYAAMNMIESEKLIIEEYKQYYNSIFIKPIDDICKKYNIENV